MVVHLIGAGDRDPQQLKPGRQGTEIFGARSSLRVAPESCEDRVGVPLIFGTVIAVVLPLDAGAEAVVAA